MGTHLLKRKEAGQSLILIALVLAILIGMVGLSVDVGSAYAEQRAAKRAADAAVLKGVDEVIKGRTDARIYLSIEETLISNGVNLARRGEPVNPGQLRMSAWYHDDAGNVMGQVGAFGNNRPPRTEKVSYIRLSLSGSTETYFARLFNTNTLAVNAQTYGARGPCTIGVYPLAVDETAFRTLLTNPAHGGTYQDSYYLGKQWRRIYLRDIGTTGGGAAWMRWSADAAVSGSPQGLLSSMIGDGNINERFEEAPWQNVGQAGPQPDNYPLTPSYITQNDWTYGGSLGSIGNANYWGIMAQELDWHKNNRTELNLPRYDYVSGEGTNAFYRVSSMSRFILRNYGYEGGRGPWVELVDLGQNKGCAMPGDIPSIPPTPPDLVGSVQIKPRYPDRSQTSGGPVDIVMILDETYSMRWVWNRDNIVGNPSRLGSMKDTAQRFIDRLDQDDRIAIVGFDSGLGWTEPYPENKSLSSYSGSQVTQAMNSTTRVYTSGPNGSQFVPTDAAGRTAVKQAIRRAFSGGTTPTALAMERARRIMEAGADTTRRIEVSPGIFRDLPVRRVVILLTDGVANGYMDGKPSFCRNSTPNLSETCVSQLASRNQPINLVNAVAENMKGDIDNLGIYVVAIGYNWNATGLPQVASGPTPPYFSRASNAAEMDVMLSRIKQSIDTSSCLPVEEDWQAPLDQGRLREPGFIGTVTLKDIAGNVIGTSPLIEEDGEVRYRFENIKPGQYELSGEVFYRDPTAAQTLRVYNWVTGNGGSVFGTHFGFPVPDSPIGNTVFGPELRFDLPENVNVCAGS